MKTLLFITASPATEEKSISKKLGRNLAEKFLSQNPDYTLEQLDLYTNDIPELQLNYLDENLNLVVGEKREALSDIEKKALDRIDELSDQFLKADRYIIAAPMWSLNFPARLKIYIDCISLGGRVILIENKRKTPKGLLKDKERKMIYLQTSGGKFPFFISGKVNHAPKYFKNLFKGLGMKCFKEILVEGVVQYRDKPNRYLLKAYKDIAEALEILR